MATNAERCGGGAERRQRGGGGRPPPRSAAGGGGGEGSHCLHSRRRPPTHPRPPAAPAPCHPSVGVWVCPAPGACRRRRAAPCLRPARRRRRARSARRRQRRRVAHGRDAGARAARRGGHGAFLKRLNGGWKRSFLGSPRPRRLVDDKLLCVNWRAGALPRGAALDPTPPRATCQRPSGGRTPPPPSLPRARVGGAAVRAARVSAACWRSAAAAAARAARPAEQIRTGRRPKVEASTTVATGAAGRTPPPPLPPRLPGPLLQRRGALTAVGSAAAVPSGRQPRGSTGAEDRRGGAPLALPTCHRRPIYPAPRRGERQ